MTDFDTLRTTVATRHRYLWRDGGRLCRACAGPAYYAAAEVPAG
jgi:hypothetical protein